MEKKTSRPQECYKNEISKQCTNQIRKKAMKLNRAASYTQPKSSYSLIRYSRTRIIIIRNLYGSVGTPYIAPNTLWFTTSSALQYEYWKKSGKTVRCYTSIAFSRTKNSENLPQSWEKSVYFMYMEILCAPWTNLIQEKTIYYSALILCADDNKRSALHKNGIKY